jgi:hypothetical protein
VNSAGLFGTVGTRAKVKAMSSASKGVPSWKRARRSSFTSQVRSSIGRIERGRVKLGDSVAVLPLGARRPSELARQARRAGHLCRHADCSGARDKAGVMAALGAELNTLSQTVSAHAVPKIGSSYYGPRFINGALTMVLTGNNVGAAKGAVKIYYYRKH